MQIAQMRLSAFLLATVVLLLDGNHNQAMASLSWPSFLGGRNSAIAPTAVPPQPPQPLPVAGTPPTYLLSPKYPIWQVHQYNGIHLKPVDMSQLPQHLKAAAGAPSAEVDVNDDDAGVQEVQTNDIDPRHPAVSDQIVYAADSDTESDLPMELQEMASSLGVTDMSKLPSLNEAMSLLGTTTADETVSIIREIAGTEDGQSLIRQFLQNDAELTSSASENEDVSLPEEQPSVGDGQAEADEEPQESVLNEERGFFGSLGGALDRTNSDLEVLQRIVTPAPPATTAVPANNSAGGLFSIITNFFRPAAPAVSLDSLTESTDTTAPTPATPIATPPNAPLYRIRESDYDRLVRQYYGQPVGPLRDSFTANFPTLSLPRLPSINQTPSLPSNFKNLPSVPQLPSIRVPGTYVRVRYPLPTIQQYQQQQQQQQQQQFRSNHISSATPPRAIVPSSISTPMAINNEPMVFELPHINPNQIVRQQPIVHTQGRTPAYTYSDISQLPLSADSLNAFRNAPHIVTSYGTPALPFTFDHDEPQTAASNNVPTIIRHQPAATADAQDDAFISSEPETALPDATSAKLQQVVSAVEDTDLGVERVEDDTARQIAQRRSSAPSSSSSSSVGPQRITAYDVVASGRLGRRANDAVIEAAIPTQKSPVNDAAMVRSVNNLTGIAFPRDAIAAEGRHADAVIDPADLDHQLELAEDEAPHSIVDN